MLLGLSTSSYKRRIVDAAYSHENPKRGITIAIALAISIPATIITRARRSNGRGNLSSIECPQNKGTQTELYLEGCL